MFSKIELNEVKKIVESKGGELLSTEYNGINEPLLIRTSDGKIIETSLRNIQRRKTLSKSKGNNKKPSIDEIKKEVKLKGAELISTEYKNFFSPLLIKFPDGEIEERTLHSIRESKKLISKKQRKLEISNELKLTFEEVKTLIESKGAKLISTYYTNNDSLLMIKFPDGEVEERSFRTIQKSKNLMSRREKKKKVSKRFKLDFDDVKKIIESKGGTLLSENYNHNRDKLKIECSCGNVFYDNIFNIKNRCELIDSLSCPKCKIHSNFESEVYAFIEKIYDGEISRNDRTIIKPYELDIVIPEKKLAIECNGIWSHSETMGGKDRYYHLNKTKLANEKGYKLIHINESDWNIKQNIIKDIIKRRMGVINKKIYARKCEVVEISAKKAKEFLEKNHLQGYSIAKYRYGLKYNGKVVSIATFSNARFNRNIQYELQRFANKIDYIVIGGFSKLFQHFVKNYNVKSIVSYCDIAYFEGIIYQQNKFQYSHRSLPNYKYFHSKNKLLLYSRNQFQKHKLEKQLRNFNPNLTEYENMKANGYDRIWDCGNDVYVWCDR